MNRAHPATKKATNKPIIKFKDQLISKQPSSGVADISSSTPNSKNK